MNAPNINAALATAEKVSRKVGQFLKRQLRSHKRINQQTAHDIKLELDERSQRMIERDLRKAFPEIAFSVRKARSGMLWNGAGWWIQLMAR